MNYTQHKTPTDNHLGDKTVIKALREGMVKLPMGTDFYLELHKVLYVPKMEKKLVSVLAMISMGEDTQDIVSKENVDYVETRVEIA